MSDWPKTMRVSGREYELQPDMSASELNEAKDSIQNELEKLVLLLMAMGVSFEEEDIEWMRQ